MNISHKQAIKEANEEYEAVQRMIERAHDAGVMVEVIHHFALEVHTGANIIDATYFALREWDA